MAWRDEIRSGATIEVVNPDADTSPSAINAWLAALEQDDDWIELPLTAAALIADDRAERDM